MDKTQNTFLIVIICLFFACTNAKKTNVTSEVNNQIVLIFNSPPPNWREYRKDSSYIPSRCEIDFIDDNFISKHFILDPSIVSDTLILHTNRKFVEFRHSYKALDNLSYIFQNGDTVLFTYKDKTPIAKVLNRKTKSIDTNFELYMRNKINPKDYPAFIKIKLPFFFRENTKYFTQADQFRQEIKRVLASAEEQYTLELIKEKRLLDSLRQNDQISEETYYFFLTKSNYQRKTAYLIQLLDQRFHANNISELSPDDFKIQLGYDQELGWINSGNILESKNDSLLYFGFYKNVINIIYYNFLSKKVKSIKTTNFVDGIATAGSVVPDYIALYDTLKESKLLSPLSKKILAFQTVQGIIEQNTIKDANLAIKRFEYDFRDTSMLSFIQSKYMLSPDSLISTSDLELTSVKSENLSFDMLIEKNRGNVIYVDFWSSRCLPCIKQFKDSDILKKHFKGKKFIHIYISIELDKKRWLKACQKYNLNSDSYFVENHYSSQQFENMNIKYVPHYYIYDKKGNLVNDFAPRPSEESLIHLLNRYVEGED